MTLPPSPTLCPAMVVEPFYKGFWDATVRIRRVLTHDKAIVDRVTCRKLTVELAERWAAIWARRSDRSQRS
jgi:hypothetical protein